MSKERVSLSPEAREGCLALRAAMIFMAVLICLIAFWRNDFDPGWLAAGLGFILVGRE